MRLAGWQLAAVPSSVVYHLGGGSLPMGNPRKTYLNFRNNLLLLHKNLPASDRKKHCSPDVFSTLWHGVNPC